MTSDSLPPPLAYAAAPRQAGVCSRFVQGVNGLTVHLLEAGEAGWPAVLLLHGFPELAYSWRHQMPALAAAGWHVIAPDQRGYGCTTGWDGRYEADLAPYRLFNLAKDVVALLHALGVREVAAVVGHDFGSLVAGWCALIRPDLFRSLVLMSAPFAGPPPMTGPGRADPTVALAALQPPRQHYQWYYATGRANEDMHHPAMGLHAFLRAYYHAKSADQHRDPAPHPLASASAAELARLPAYYVMPFGLGMPAAVAQYAHEAVQASRASGAAGAPASHWLPDAELAVYSTEYARLGFQGGLHWYRCITDPAQMRDLQMYDGARVSVPACYVAGAADWGIYQSPGAFERMQREACADWRGTYLLPGAGHWVQQEQPQAVTALLLDFLAPRRATA